MANEFIIKNGFRSQGNSEVTGSLSVSSGITGSLQGTASFATTASVNTNGNPLIGGSITSGQVAFGTASGVIGGDSGLFWDNVNKRLGVGTAAPVYGLDVVGLGAVGQIRSQSGLISPNLQAIGSSLVLRGQATYGIEFYSNNIYRANLTSAGNFVLLNSMQVGANVNPTARLDVQAQGALSTDIAFRVRNSANTLDIIRAQGDGSVFVGLGAGNVNTGANNSFFGIDAGRNNTTGVNNTANGVDALSSNTTGANNTANGQNALSSNTTGANNTANGVQALRFNTTGFSNTANGVNALLSNTTVGSNTANGFQAGRFIADGTTSLTISNNSVFLGSDTKALANNQTNQIVIGHNAIGAGSNTATIGNTSIVKTILRGTLNAANLPTSPVGLVTGDIWNNLGILTIV